jgi:two-component system, sensor histidine kinase PdtaS
MPQRIAHRVPPILVELVVGIVAALVMVYLRMLLTGFTSERAPYALNFLAVVLATLIAGWRSGLVTLVGAQVLVWFLLVPPTWSFEIKGVERVAGFAMATISQAVILLILGLYQREIDKGVAERDRRMELQEQALREIDHRTRNNYSTVLALVQLQAQRSKDANVKAALEQVADRIQAIASATERLASNSDDIDRIRLDDHLCELLQHIERGMARDGIRIDCEVDEISAGAETATSISIIVNELVTNAIKHAFNGGASGHVRVVGSGREAFELIVADNGRGITPGGNGQGNGLGTRLVESFVRQLKAKHEVVSTESGTTHRLLIPDLG